MRKSAEMWRKWRIRRWLIERNNKEALKTIGQNGVGGLSLLLLLLLLSWWWQLFWCLLLLFLINYGWFIIGSIPLMEPKAAGDKDMFWARSWASMTSISTLTGSWVEGGGGGGGGGGAGGGDVHDMSPLLVTCCCCGCMEWCGASSVQCQLGSPLEAFNGFTILSFTSSWLNRMKCQRTHWTRWAPRQAQGGGGGGGGWGEAGVGPAKIPSNSATEFFLRRFRRRFRRHFHKTAESAPTFAIDFLVQFDDFTRQPLAKWLSLLILFKRK